MGLWGYSRGTGEAGIFAPPGPFQIIPPPPPKARLP